MINGYTNYTWRWERFIMDGFWWFNDEKVHSDGPEFLVGADVNPLCARNLNSRRRKVIWARNCPLLGSAPWHKVVCASFPRTLLSDGLLPTFELFCPQGFFLLPVFEAFCDWFEANHDHGIKCVVTQQSSFLKVLYIPWLLMHKCANHYNCRRGDISEKAYMIWS